jgi:hypothetical protein
VSSISKKKYTARVCWNTNQWIFPSGDARHLETDTYVVDAGFGHEEWLFNFVWLINGFHYGFLQPINKSFDKVTGKIIDVLLYTINPKKDRLYVGEISSCEILSLEQAEEAMGIYKKREWFKSMAESVGEFGGKIEYILGETNAKHLFNLRFKPENVNIYDPLLLADRRDAVWSRNRYILAAADDKIVKEWYRAGKTTPPLIKVITRKGVPEVTYDPFHKRLQSELLKGFQKRYGIKNVVLERNNVDITVTDGTRGILIELKTNPSSQSAIREALGQLLEYAYYRSSEEWESVALVIIAPGMIDELAKKYIQRLRSQFKIPISYYSYAEGDPLPELS